MDPLGGPWILPLETTRLGTIMRKYSYAWLTFCLACGSQAESRFNDTTTIGSGGAGGTGIIDPTGAGGSGIVAPGPKDSGTPDAPVIITTLPPGFTQTEVGGFKLGGALTGTDAGSGVDAGSGNDNCGNILLGVVRDFKGRDNGG